MKSELCLACNRFMGNSNNVVIASDGVAYSCHKRCEKGLFERNSGYRKADKEELGGYG